MHQPDRPLTARSQRALDAFLASVAQAGARPADGAAWRGQDAPYALICANGHHCTPRPNNVKRGSGLCKTCAGRDSEAAQQEFLAGVGALGGRPAPGATWRGSNQPYPLICPAGHPCAPHPSSIRKGQGLCAVCADRDSEAAHAAFLQRIAQLGARPAADATWLGSDRGYPLICAEGHDCAPRPDHVKSGGGVCRTCARQDSDVAHATFLARIADLGAQPAPGATWQGSGVGYPLVCAAGHTCAPRPSAVLAGRGLCKTCASRDPDAAHAAFLTRVVELGGRPADNARWRGSNASYPLVCQAGHRCAPLPKNVQRGSGLCRICAGQDSDTAYAAFLERVTSLGAQPAPDAVWRGTKQSYPLICAAGHHCQPLPNNVLRGHGACLECSATFERVYLLEHCGARAVKVGVASGPARVRLHQSRGYRLVAQWSGLDHQSASAAEREVIGSWRTAGWLPVRECPSDGRTETAPAHALSASLSRLTTRLGEPDELPVSTAAA